MYIGERFERDGKMVEVTGVFGNGNYAFKEVKETKTVLPVFADDDEKPKRSRKKG